MNQPNILDALEAVGLFTDDLNAEYNSLPNEYTRGRLEGARDAYKIVLDIVKNPRPKQDESQLFTEPPVNPDTGIIQKPLGTYRLAHSYQQNSDQMVDMLSNVQQAQPVIDQSGFTLADVVSELYQIRQFIFSKWGDQPVVEENVQENFEKAFEGEVPTVPESSRRVWDQSLGQRKMGTSGSINLGHMDEESREKAQADMEIHEWGHEIEHAKMNGDSRSRPAPPELVKKYYPGVEVTGKKTLADHEREVNESRDRLKEYHQPTLPPEEEYVDFETGETVRKRTIGGRINVDDDDLEDKPVRTWDEYVEKQEAQETFTDPTPRVYTPQHPQFDELEDLGPGD